MLFDTHAHFEDAQFDRDREAVIQSLPSYGVGWVTNIGSDIETSVRSAELASRYENFYAAVGIHPSCVGDMTEADMETLKQLVRENPKVRAIGEIGLDYHYDDTEPELQKVWFRRQLELADELHLPVVIHDRESKGECIRILKEMQVHNGVMHCFSGSAETAKELVKMGFMVSFTGVLTFKNARRAVEACAAVPAERLMIETDCPYMAPEPHRGERNFSGYVKLVAEKMAEIKGLSVDEMIRITTENGKRFYGI